MRLTGWGTRIVRPVSSVTSRKIGDAEETGEAPCARDIAVQNSRTATEAKAALRRRERVNSFTTLPSAGNLCSTTKKPHETPWGFRHRSFSRRARPSAAWEGGLAYGFSADYSGGTAADSHGLPRYPCLQIEIRVYAAPRAAVNDQREAGESVCLMARRIHRGFCAALDAITEKCTTQEFEAADPAEFVATTTTSSPMPGAVPA